MAASPLLVGPRTFAVFSIRQLHASAGRQEASLKVTREQRSGSHDPQRPRSARAAALAWVAASFCLSHFAAGAERLPAPVLHWLSIKLAAPPAIAGSGTLPWLETLLLHALRDAIDEEMALMTPSVGSARTSASTRFYQVTRTSTRNTASGERVDNPESPGTASPACLGAAMGRPAAIVEV